MVEKHGNRFSTLLDIKKMQVTINFTLTRPVKGGNLIILSAEKDGYREI